jgi:hypothetical protein
VTRATALALVLAVVVPLLSVRIVAVRTENVNWDEFALLDRAALAARSHELRSGGRPGLGTLALVPFVEDCDDEIGVARAARLAWLALTLGMLAGLFALLLEVGRASPRRASNAALGVALLACVPAFLRWSLQVRTDQLALCAGLWGGVALLASRRRPWLAALAGVAFGVGYLATQKLAYVAALVALLAAFDEVSAPDRSPARAARRAVACALCALAVILAFDVGVAAFYRVATGSVVLGTLGSFAFYRETLGFAHYRAMLPTLLPHGALLLALVAASVAAARRRERSPALVVAWAVLLLGLVVALAHAGAFFYFWMTLGLFPAVALALGADAIRAAPAPRWRRAATFLFAAVWLGLGAQAAVESRDLLRDTQSVQAASLAFVARNFAPQDRGFQAEHADFCRADPDPFPVYFSQLIHKRFSGPQAPENGQAFLEEFKTRPVKFMVSSWRMNQFPPAIQSFWRAHYQPYFASVWVAGRRISGREGDVATHELIVSGPYRWLPQAPGSALVVDGERVEPGGVIELAAGSHRVELEADVASGLLVLALPEPPGRHGPFYKGFF